MIICRSGGMTIVVSFCIEMNCIIILVLIFCVSGCADYTIDNPIKDIYPINVERLVDRGLNRGPNISVWCRKHDVLRKWGMPDEVKLVGETPVWGAPVQRWTYYSWVPGFPVNYRYISKNYRLYFQGDILVRMESTDIASESENKFRDKYRVSGPIPQLQKQE